MERSKSTKSDEGPESEIFSSIEKINWEYSAEVRENQSDAVLLDAGSNFSEILDPFVGLQLTFPVGSLTFFGKIKFIAAIENRIY